MTLDDVIPERNDLLSYHVRGLGIDEDNLFVKASHVNAPKWVTYLEPHVDENLESLLSSSAAAALVMRVGERTFALAFGQGRHLLEAEAVVHDFGLKVVLNTVAYDQLKSVDARSVDELTVHTRRDVSRDSSFEAFGLDVTRDLIRTVTGTPRDDTLARKLTGSTALALNTRVQVPDLPELAERLLERYAAVDYREHFDFIDHLRPVSDPGVIARLQDELLDDLRSWEIDDVHLAPPEVLDHLEIEGFRFTTQPRDNEPDVDPRISAYLDSTEPESLSLDQLKGDRVVPLRASDGVAQRGWSVYRCIVYETHDNDRLYVLSAGDWYEVSLGFKRRVDEDVRRLPALELDLPEAQLNESEGHYNERAAQAIGALCLDEKLVRDEGPDKMEICDLLMPTGTLIHVKKRGRSSTLSHLFAQGVNSAERLRGDEDFRNRARTLIAAEDHTFAEVVPAQRPDPARHDVGFVVITRSTRDTFLTLPFFSLVSLRAAAQRLENQGFRVRVAKVFERPPA
jgi:uncharacterized protein (TIGR04141 family)